MKIIPTFWVQFKIGEPSLATEGYEHQQKVSSLRFTDANL